MSLQEGQNTLGVSKYTPKRTKIALSLVLIPEWDILKSLGEKIMHYVISCLTNEKLFLVEIILHNTTLQSS